MSLPPSSLTPLGFTREYQAYRAANFDIPFIDSRLLAAVRFWSRFIAALESDSYSSFWLEDLPPLLATSSSFFEDLHPAELAEIAEFVTRLSPSRIPATLTAASVWELAARKWFYAGEAERALRCLATGGLRRPALNHAIPNQSIDPPHLPSFLISQLGNEHEPLRDWLTRFDAEWRAFRESGVTNQATCVLVEHDVAGRPIRGRLRVLEAHVETLAKGREEDEVVFGHQLCAADDPQVRGAYSALAALRNAEFGIRNAESTPGAPDMPNPEFRIPHSYLRAKFTFINGSSREPYGGDSLAFACFAAAYGDWWSKDLHRERRLVSSQAALTGALDSSGKAQAISENSLSKKVERVFFSPLSYVAIPQANRAVAESELERLQELYPNRRVRLVTVDRASDLSSDGNIIIPERVCFGEYAVRAATKYTRSLKVQVPILFVLVYLLLCLVYPKAWPWFDWNPSEVRFTGGGMSVLNEEGKTLWVHDFGYRHDSAASISRLGNLDNDSDREILCLLCSPEGELTPLVGQLFAFDHDGILLFQRSAIILNEYPGDTSELQFYQGHTLDILETSSGTHILTGVSKWMPARVHFRVWDVNGNPVSWYINAGSAGGREAQKVIVDSLGNNLHIIGTNNRVNASCLFSINLDSSSGASPPYADSNLDLGSVKRGNQVRYYIFPNTDLATARSSLYNRAKLLIQETPSLFRFDVDEFGGNRLVQDSVAEIMYYFDNQWRLVEARCSDAFISARNDLVAQGRLPKVDWSAYEKELLQRVRVWTDTGWSSVY